MRGLNNGKHMYQILIECVDYFHNFNILKPALEHIGPIRAILDNNDPYWSTCDLSGPYQSMVFPIEHYRPCGTIWDHALLYGTIQNSRGQYKYKSVHRAPQDTLTEQRPCSGSYQAMQAYKGSYNVNQG